MFARYLPRVAGYGLFLTHKPWFFFLEVACARVWGYAVLVSFLVHRLLLAQVLFPFSLRKKMTNQRDALGWSVDDDSIYRAEGRVFVRATAQQATLVNHGGPFSPFYFVSTAVSALGL